MLLDTLTWISWEDLAFKIDWVKNWVKHKKIRLTIQIHAAGCHDVICSTYLILQVFIICSSQLFVILNVSAILETALKYYRRTAACKPKHFFDVLTLMMGGSSSLILMGVFCVCLILVIF